MNLYRTMGVIAGTAVVLLAVGYPFRDDTHGWRWIVGGIGWFGFLVCVVALVVLALTAAVRTALGRRAGTT